MEGVLEMIASTDFSSLAIHGPRVVGTSPGRPFLFRIPATGKGSLRFEALGLPDSLQLDPKSGIISGVVISKGIWVVKVIVTDSNGSANRTLNIVAGDHKLAQTPPMGWNSWNVWGKHIDELKIRQAAEGLLTSKLAAFGYQYVNIDDGWEGVRCAKGRIHPNDRFPDMKILADFVHEKGLKLGIYSSPGPTTCQGLEGSYQHEAEDARTFAEWGIDYLKYDWCSYSKIAKKPLIPLPQFFHEDHFYVHFRYELAELVKPYQKMREELDKIPRDIVYSLCPMTYKGKLNASYWGPHVKANLWRTSGDIRDNWKSMSHIGFCQHKFYQNMGPGYWNDPDMLVIGVTGCDRPLHPTQLSQVEQVTQMSLWTILAAPLLLSCDLNQLDPFTLNLLTNTEVIDVDQDPLGQMANRIMSQSGIELYSRPLWDGTHAIGVFNRAKKNKMFTIDWQKIKMQTPSQIRDLWMKQELDVNPPGFSFEIPAHGARLFKVGFPNAKDFVLPN
jgi:alpha-galactosidase